MHTVRGYSADAARSDEGDERMCFLPLCHVAERIGGAYLAMYSGGVHQLRREPRDRAGERARDRADRVPRGAARLGEVLLRRA